MKYYLLTSNEDWADEHNVPALAVMNEKELDKWKKSNRNIYAHLGNGGDDFMENMQGETGEALIRFHKVDVFEVDKSFSKFFKKADLSSLSLSNIFEEDDWEDEDYDGDDMLAEQGMDF